MTALGIVLVLVGATLVVAEAHVPTLGALGATGTCVLVAGAVLAILGAGGGVALVVPIALAVTLASGGFLLVAARRAAGARRGRIRAGSEALVGNVGVVRGWSEPDAGQVLVSGALWRARRSVSDDEPEPLAPGDRVVVERLSGLTLSVRKAEEWELEL